MLGRYEIEVYNKRVHYFLTIKRNITILQGHSATGKTELIRLISDYEQNGISSGVTVKCAAACTVLTNVDWENRLSRLSNYIVFIDEAASFISSKSFAESVRGADNYFVIVSRDDLEQLPYSVDEIYGLRNVSNSSKYKAFKQVYNEMYHLYNLEMLHEIQPAVVLTEDSNAGFECFCMIYGGICQSAVGKSNVYNAIRSIETDNILVIVDGAAFGSEIGKVIRYLDISDKKCVIYAPESFEYLLLKSRIVGVSTDILDKTYEYADSKEYISWEEFYTKYLIQKTQGTIYRYRKSKLTEAYKTEGAIIKIINVIPKRIRPKFIKKGLDKKNERE